MPVNFPKLKENLSKMYRFLKSRNIRGLRELSNTFTQDLLIYQDQLYLTLALSSIVLAKMIEKPRFWKYEEWKDIVFSIEESVGSCVAMCDAQDKQGIQGVFKDVLDQLVHVEKKDLRHVNTIVEQGRVKIGALLYAQGLSLGNAAALSGASKESIQQYSGGTLISDRFGKTYSIAERIRNVRGLFRD
ncbi:MAG: hypothetical protein QXU54_03710 [Candidatus Micrarchaeia archaeon]